MSALYARAVRNVADVKALCGDAVAGAGSLERDESLIEVLSAKEASFAAHKSFHAGCFFASSAKVCTCMLPLGVGENCEWCAVLWVQWSEAVALFTEARKKVEAALT
jgi:hypothetical protein